MRPAQIRWRRRSGSQGYATKSPQRELRRLLKGMSKGASNVDNPVTPIAAVGGKVASRPEILPHVREVPLPQHGIPGPFGGDGILPEGLFAGVLQQRRHLQETAACDSQSRAAAN